MLFTTDKSSVISKALTSTHVYIVFIDLRQ